MKEFTINWVIDILADSPEEACETAREIQQDPNSTATYFRYTWYDKANQEHSSLLCLDPRDNPGLKYPRQIQEATTTLREKTFWAQLYKALAIGFLITSIIGAIFFARTKSLLNYHPTLSKHFILKTMKTLTAIPQHASKTWISQDVDLEISLEEHQVIATQDMKDCTAPDEYFCVYPIGEVDTDGSGPKKHWDWGYIRIQELDNLVEGNDWMQDNDIKSFLSYTGQPLEDLVTIGSNTQT